MIDFTLTVLAVFVAQILVGFFYSVFKANQYENVLANKIAKEVAKELSKT